MHHLLVNREERNPEELKKTREPSFCRALPLQRVVTVI